MLVHSEESSSATYALGQSHTAEQAAPGAPSPPVAVECSSSSSSSNARCDGDVTYTGAEMTALASSVATTVAKSVLHPLDTVKCRLQLLRTDVGRTPRSRLQQLRHQYAGQWTPRHLYGGLPVKLILYVPYQATYVSSYDFAQSALRQSSGAAGQRDVPAAAVLWHTVAAAVFAEVVSAGLRVPMETMKMRIQSTVAADSLHAVRQLRGQGLLSCVRLAVPQTLMHDIPYSVVQWVVYESLRPWTQQWGSRVVAEHEGGGGAAAASAGSSGFWELYGASLARTFVSGGFSGLLASALTVPLDNIRTRVVVATARHPHLTVTEVVRGAYQREGVRGFVRGGGMRVLWVSLNMACYFPLFEGVRSLLQRRASSGGAPTAAASSSSTAPPA
ncbi:mitochondrial carrier protein-like protein [Novymonas esmeraldas]|uniref:Mitochondrial carrier protein-like protein n=1 Tax=Novymonas esmeraldas TaxID=1808958 RepID=A0AAW0EPS7_9TRYP